MSFDILRTVLSRDPPEGRGADGNLDDITERHAAARPVRRVEPVAVLLGFAAVVGAVAVKVFSWED